ncbi:hypothetical protein Talka_02011 [Tepidimonas alkaliphilus]|uniref:Uncharacterized protein n=1 Tax=Tepidimonas alkaliphilus TaxID=2588942 RepID=A0A554W568_9BURK|nr:hypothetical protein [Tepidimonas alkaliphilus]TSE18720.1 hypothetical protein Talka_02011 [Tepidimonas alkaliphilus]
MKTEPIVTLDEGLEANEACRTDGRLRQARRVDDSPGVMREPRPAHDARRLAVIDHELGNKARHPVRHIEVARALLPA